MPLTVRLGEKNLMVQLSPMGAAVVPLVEGKPMSREEFLALSEVERKRSRQDVWK